MAPLLSSGRRVESREIVLFAMERLESMSRASLFLTKITGPVNETLPKLLPNSKAGTKRKSVLERSVTVENLAALGDGQPFRFTAMPTGVLGQVSTALDTPSLSLSVEIIGEETVIATIASAAFTLGVTAASLQRMYRVFAPFTRLFIVVV